MNLTDITKQIRAFADQLENTQTTPPIDPYAELKAAHAAGKVIQCEQDYKGSGNWLMLSKILWDEEPCRYRIKPESPPFQLPPPPPGMQWHRVDGWKAEDLPPGTRPHIRGESDFLGDELFDYAGRWIKLKSATVEGSYEGSNRRRTTRPLVFEHAGKSWTYHRPGDPMPCDGERKVYAMFHDFEIRGASDPARFGWGTEVPWKIIGWRYAAPLTREVELGPEDVPPCSAVKGPSDGDNEYALVSGVGKRGIILSDGRVIAFSHMRSGWLINRPNHRDSSGNPTLWEPCHKTIPQNG